MIRAGDAATLAVSPPDHIHVPSPLNILVLLDADDAALAVDGFGRFVDAGVDAGQSAVLRERPVRIVVEERFRGR
jgi:hypothetical protein